MTDHDVVIIGAGTAGLSAAIYSARLGMNTVVLESLMPGGQIINAEAIEDYPGINPSISGAELTGIMQEQAMSAGAEIRLSEVTHITEKDNNWLVSTYEEPLYTKSVIIACGSQLKKLNVPGENEFVGSGVSYCATCDGAFFIDQDVCVIGGGDSAIQEAISLTEFARNIHIYCKEQSSHAQEALKIKATTDEKIKFHFETEICEITGNGMVEGISFRKVGADRVQNRRMDGVFIFVGLEPNTSYLEKLVELDRSGHIVTNSSLQTSQNGILAAGDVRSHSVAQLASSSGDGVTAAINAHKYIKSGLWESKS